MTRKLLLSQGIFYLLTGIWPMLHIESFVLVTGPKTDIWLVKMVGLLSIAIALSILSQSTQRQQSLLLSISTAISFFTIDLYYTISGTISKIYLADASVELIFIIIALFVSGRKLKA